MSRSASNLEVLVEMWAGSKRKLELPKKKISELISDSYKTIDNSYTSVANSASALKSKVAGLVKDEKNAAKEVFHDLSFRTTFQDYRDTIFESNFMPTYRRIHPDLEDSFVMGKIGHFGTLMAFFTDYGTGMGLGLYGAAHKDATPYLIYLGAKAVSHGFSAFYEQFRKTKQKLESSG